MILMEFPTFFRKPIVLENHPIGGWVLLLDVTRWGSVGNFIRGGIATTDSVDCLKSGMSPTTNTTHRGKG